MYRHRFLPLLILSLLLISGVIASRMTPPRLFSRDNPQRVADADAARWVALGEAYAHVGFDSRRTAEADTARWVALGQAYRQRVRNADVARWVALGEAYASLALHAEVLISARYTGLALQEYARTGNRALLPQCLSPQMLALLPPIGDNRWRAEVSICSE